MATSGTRDSKNRAAKTVAVAGELLVVEDEDTRKAVAAELEVIDPKDVGTLEDLLNGEKQESE